MSTDQLLRTLDSATLPTDAQHRRADALLERIMVEPITPNKRGIREVIGRHPSFWRVGAILAAGAVVAGIAIGAPGLPPQSAAVASWTPEAEAVSAADLAIAEEVCRDQFTQYRGSSDIPLSLSERRGDVVALLFYRDDPETASSCVVDLPRGADTPREATSGSGGSSGPAPTAPADGFIEGAVASYTLGGQVLSVISGSVGSNVKSMTVRGAGEQATATIADGRYAAWLPGNVFINLGEPSGKGGPEVAVAYDLVLDDGTLVTDAKATFP
jgi:hypothetical protein